MSETDWKEVAMQLAERVEFAAQHLEVRSGTDLVMNMETGKTKTWRNYMAEGLELIPGLKIDREVLAALSLPAKQRRKRLAQIDASKNNR